MFPDSFAQAIAVAKPPPVTRVRPLANICSKKQKSAKLTPMPLFGSAIHIRHPMTTKYICIALSSCTAKLANRTSRTLDAADVGLAELHWH